MGRKIEVQELYIKILSFAKQFLRPCQSGAHGTCHACHTLDTPLQINVLLYYCTLLLTFQLLSL